MGLSSWFRNASVSEADVRREIWQLGTRHFGQPLEGAIEELKARDLPVRQAMILRACVQKLQSA